MESGNRNGNLKLLINSYLNELENLISGIQNSEDFKNSDNWEIKEKIKIYKSSLEILQKYKNHSLIKYEVIYQQYRTSFSEAYFSGSEWYRGDSFIDWYKNRPFGKVYKELLPDIMTTLFIKNALGIEQ